MKAAFVCFVLLAVGAMAATKHDGLESDLSKLEKDVQAMLHVNSRVDEDPAGTNTETSSEGDAYFEALATEDGIKNVGKWKAQAQADAVKMESNGYMSIVKAYERELKGLKEECEHMLTRKDEEHSGVPSQSHEQAYCYRKFMMAVKDFHRKYQEKDFGDDVPELQKLAGKFAANAVKVFDNWNPPMVLLEESMKMTARASDKEALHLASKAATATSPHCQGSYLSKTRVDWCLKQNARTLADSSFMKRVKAKTQTSTRKMEEDADNDWSLVPELLILGASGTLSMPYLTGGLPLGYGVAGIEMVWDMHTLEGLPFGYVGGGVGAAGFSGAGVGLYASVGLKMTSRNKCLKSAYSGWFNGGDFSVQIAWLPGAGVLGALSATGPVAPVINQCICGGIGISWTVVPTPVKANVAATYYKALGKTNKYRNAYSFIWYEGNIFRRLVDAMRSKASGSSMPSPGVDRAIKEVEAVGTIISAPITAVLSIGTTANWFTGRNTKCRN